MINSDVPKPLSYEVCRWRGKGGEGCWEASRTTVKCKTYGSGSRHAIGIQYLQKEVEELLHDAGECLQDLTTALGRNVLEGDHILHKAQEHLQHQLCLSCLQQQQQQKCQEMSAKMVSVWISVIIVKQ